MTPTTLERTLRVDAVANALAGVALVAAGGWLAAPVGLTAGWPIRLAGLALAVYAVENLMVARRPSAGGPVGLIAVDVAFAAAVLAVAIANPSGAETWVRWLLVAAADLSLAFGIAKLHGLRSRRDRDAHANA
ncbi:MAG: hypothetical protein ACRDUY_15370 [Nitriliruptorales bacterium]